MENFETNTPNHLIHEREYYVSRILTPSQIKARWELIKYSPVSFQLRLWL